MPNAGDAIASMIRNVDGVLQIEAPTCALTQRHTVPLRHQRQCAQGIHRLRKRCFIVSFATGPALHYGDQSRPQPETPSPSQPGSAMAVPSPTAQARRSATGS